ncbi:MAG: serine hydrolase domain-containing protein [Acidobacteriota bacterium]
MIVEEELDAILTAGLEQTGAPAVVAGVFRDGELVYQLARGMADLEPEAPATVDMAFEVGSVSKHFTAVALLQQVEAGTLTLDDRLGDHLADRLERLPEAWWPVTLRQLLSHTSGIPDYEAAATYSVYEEPTSAAEVLAIVADRPMDFEPGSEYRYSNTGYYLLCLVLEAVTGKTTLELFESSLFEPSAMRTASVGPPAEAHMAQGHKPENYENQRGLLEVPPIASRSSLGAGAVTLTLADWGGWEKALSTGALVGSSSLEASYTRSRLSSGEEIDYALGMVVSPRRGERRYRHSGQTAGFTTSLERYPERGLAILLLANRYGGRLRQLASQVALAVMPDLRYEKWPLLTEVSVDETAIAKRALEQAVLGTEPLDLLSDSLRDFAVAERFADERRQIAASVANLQAFEAIDRTVVGSTRRLVFRGRYPEGLRYWTMRFDDDALVGLSWDEE